MTRGCRAGSHKRGSTPCPKQQAKPVGLQPDLECHTATKVTCVASDDKVTCVAIDGSDDMPAIELTRRDVLVALATLFVAMACWICVANATQIQQAMCWHAGLCIAKS
eukprot:3568491-Amphidinium_carterae.1